MGPIRGYKKRRKTEKKVEQKDFANSEEGSVDWWDDFSKRISGIYIYIHSLKFLLIYYLFYAVLLI